MQKRLENSRVVEDDVLMRFEYYTSERTDLDFDLVSSNLDVHHNWLYTNDACALKVTYTSGRNVFNYHESILRLVNLDRCRLRVRVATDFTTLNFKITHLIMNTTPKHAETELFRVSA